MDKKARAKYEAMRACLYHRMGGFYNHGGALPCLECEACRNQKAANDRVRRWNDETAAGADPKR